MIQHTQKVVKCDIKDNIIISNRTKKNARLLRCRAFLKTFLFCEKVGDRLNTLPMQSFENAFFGVRQRVATTVLQKPVADAAVLASGGGATCLVDTCNQLLRRLR